MDEFISQINAKSNLTNITAKYSTAEAYFSDLHSQVLQDSIEFETISDDLFPYEDKKGAYWTGYYESRS